MRYFVWCRGQDDNVGDTVLRRAMIDALRSERDEMHVLVGAGSASYEAGLCLRDDDRAYHSRKSWLIALYASALRRRAVLFMNPGEVRLDRQATLAHLLLLPAQVLAPSFRLGVTLRPGTALGRRILQLSVRLSRLNVWRDNRTPGAFAGQVAPDWAFLLVSPPGDLEPERTRLALTFRSDSPSIPDAVLAEIRSAAQATGLEIVTFAQVRRDRAAMEELAGKLGCEYRDWPEDLDHYAFEVELREWFRSCALVLSDRLHALVVAATEGAVPIGLVSGSTTKLHDHFAAARVPLALVQYQEADAPEATRIAVETAQHSSDELARSLTEARHRLLQVQEMVSALIRKREAHGR